MTYQVVVEENREEFERKVNAALADGWVVCGGVSYIEYTVGAHESGGDYVSAESYARFVQALTKTE